MIDSPMTPAMLGGATFNALPFELLGLITDHINRPTDMVSLCLTSHKLHAVTIPRLYRSIDLYLGGGSFGKVASMLKPSNIGLNYVKEVDVYLLDRAAASTEHHIQEAHFAVRMLLELLPAHQLGRFRWRSWTPFKLSNYQLLLKTQQNLSSLDVIALDEYPVDYTKIFENYDTSKVDSICLYPDDMDLLPSCGQVVQRTKNLRHLTITSTRRRQAVTASSSSSSEREKWSCLDRLLQSTLAGRQAGVALDPLCLTNLELCEMDLGIEAELYPQLTQLSRLGNLCLRSCKGLDTFLAMLSRPSNLPSGLKTLFILQRDRHDHIPAVERFMALLTGLVTLSFESAWAQRLPDVTSIVKHKATLKTLSIHAHPEAWTSACDAELNYTPKDLGTLLDACQGLEQLSISATSKPTTDEGHPHAPYDPFPMSTGRLPRLRTLQLTPYPAAPVQPVGIQQYAGYLQGVAQGVIQDHRAHNTNSHLSLVAFGAFRSARSGPREASPAPNKDMIFARAVECGAPDGREATAPRQVSLCDAQYIERHSQILSFGFSAREIGLPAYVKTGLEAKDPAGWAELLC